MLKLAEYLHRAAECRDLARTTASPSHRAELEKMALTWEKLAEHRLLPGWRWAGHRIGTVGREGSTRRPPLPTSATAGDRGRGPLTQQTATRRFQGVAQVPQQL
jgi:hypothetical protein